MVDIDLQDVKAFFLMLGAACGLFLCTGGIGMLVTAAAMGTFNALAVLFTVLGPPLAVLSIWYFKHDREEVEKDVLRMPMVIYGPLNFAINRFRGVGRIICENVTEYDATHYLFTVENSVVQKALNFQRRKHRVMSILDGGPKSGAEPTDEMKIQLLHQKLHPADDFSKYKAEYEKALFKKIDLPEWAQHFTQIDLRYEYQMRGISIYQMHVVTRNPFYTEFQKGPYTLSGLRPMLFIDMTAACAWLIKIGEAMAEVDINKDHLSVPIVTPFFDLYMAEELMREIVGPNAKNEVKNGEIEQLTTNIDESKENIAKDAERVSFETVKAISAYQAEQLEHYQQGDSDTTRKMEQLQSDLWISRDQVKDLLAEIRVLQRQIALPPPRDPNRFTIKGLVLATLFTGFGCFSFGMVAALLLHLGA